MKKHNIAGLSLLTSLFLTFTACKKDAVPTAPVPDVQENSVSVENGRLAFKTADDFYKYIDAVKPEASGKAGFHSLYAAFNEAYGKPGIEPRLSPTLSDLTKFKFPASFLATLNEKGEVKIGDEIIWYHNGAKYFIPSGKANEIESLKRTPEAIEKSLPVASAKLNARTTLGIDALDARHQREFWQVSSQWGEGWRKFVHEIDTYRDPYYQPFPGITGFNAYVYLRIKMEWKGCCDWNPAGETRDVQINISGSATIQGTTSPYGSYTTGPTFNHNISTTTSQNYEVLLAKYVGLGTVDSGSWQVDVNGSIYQYVQQDSPANAWTNSGIPLW